MTLTVEAIIEAAKQLGQAERMRVVEEVWDSVAAEGGRGSLTPAQTAELDRRLDLLEREGSTGTPWEDVRREFLARRGLPS